MGLNRRIKNSIRRVMRLEDPIYEPRVNYVSRSQVYKELRIRAEIQECNEEEIREKALVYYLTARQIEDKGGRIVVFGKQSFGTDTIEFR